MILSVSTYVALLKALARRTLLTFDEKLLEIIDEERVRYYREDAKHVEDLVARIFKEYGLSFEREVPGRLSARVVLPRLDETIRAIAPKFGNYYFGTLLLREENRLMSDMLVTREPFEGFYLKSYTREHVTLEGRADFLIEVSEDKRIVVEVKRSIRKGDYDKRAYAAFQASLYAAMLGATHILVIDGARGDERHIRGRYKRPELKIVKPREEDILKRTELLRFLESLSE